MRIFNKSSKAIDQEVVYEEGQVESFAPNNDDLDADQDPYGDEDN